MNEDHSEPSTDAIIYDEDGETIDVKDSYILGLPFIHVFMTHFDFENDKVGLAQKKNNFGAIIVQQTEPIILNTTVPDPQINGS